MSGHDEESIPLEDAQKSGERTESAENYLSTGEPGEPAEPGTAETQPPTAESEELTSQVEHTLLRIRAALEQKDWQAVADAMGLDSVFLNGHPEPVAKVVQDLTATTTNLCDFEGVLLRVNKNEIAAESGRFSLRFRIMWNSCDDWEDHDLYIDAHAGYARGEDGWKISYLSLNSVPVQAEPPAPKASAPAEAAAAAKEPTPAAAEVPPSPPVPAAPTRSIPRLKRAATAGRPLRLPPRPASAPPAAAAPKQAEHPLSDDYFSRAAAQYFGQVATPEKSGEIKSVIPGSSVGGKHHLLYVPIVMHEDLIKKILGGD